MNVRTAAEEDAGAVRQLVEAAFGRAPEADLVADLTNDGDAEISLVAEAGRRLLGYVMLSRMTAPFPALALAPVSVDPKIQGVGIGGTLIIDALDRARRAGWSAIFVLGSPLYYGRFGFDAALAAGFSSPYASPAFMGLALSAPLATLSGALRHAPAFTRLDARSTGPRASREANSP